MANWLERAHDVFQKTPTQAPAKTDEMPLSAVLAVTHHRAAVELIDKVESFDSNGSTPLGRFRSEDARARTEGAPRVAPAIIAASNASAENDPAVEARRERVLAILAAQPDLRYAIITDSAAEPGVVVLHVAIRGVGSGEILIAESRYDGVELLRAMERAEAGEIEGGA